MPSAGQLQRMGILDTKPHKDNNASATRRISLQPDLASLAPLKPGGAAGFAKFRDHTNIEEGLGKSRKKPRRGSESGMDDSDYDDDDDGLASILHKAEEEEDKDVSSSLLSADDIRRQGELAEGVRQIKVSFIMLFIFIYTHWIITTGVVIPESFFIIFSFIPIVQNIVLTIQIFNIS